MLAALSSRFHVVVAGGVAGLLTVNVAVALAVLIFAGSLADFTPTGISMALVAAVVANIAVALGSSYAGTVATPQDRVAPLLAVMAASIAALMAGKASDGAVLATVIAAVFVSTLLTGLAMLTLGVTGWGSLVRYVPYPVIGGFLAGSGWLFLTGAVGVMAGETPTLGSIVPLLQPDSLLHWLPGMGLAILLLLARRRTDHPLILPAMLLAAVGVFYLAVFLTGTTLDELRASDWLVGPLPSGRLWQILPLSAFGQIDWEVLLSQAGVMASIVLVSIISVPLATSAISVISQEDIEQNRELRVAGWTSMVSGLFGGMTGTQSLSQTTLIHQLNVRSRATAILSAGIALVVLAGGGSLLSYFPKPVAGALVAFLGLSLLTTWLYDTYRRLPKTDYGLIVLIVATVAAFGYLAGVLVGVLVAVVLFAFSYSRLNIVRHALTGSQRQSNVFRPPLAYRYLRERGPEVYILELQNFIFFGTVSGVVDRVLARVADPQAPPLRFLVLDFRAVTGVDSSAVLGFQRMRHQALKHGFTLVFTGLRSGIRRQFLQQGITEPSDLACLAFPDLDRGLEWCEEALLASPDLDQTWGPHGVNEWLASLLPLEASPALLRPLFERVDLQPGDCLVRQGDVSDCLYFVESGRVSVVMAGGDSTVRLRTFGPGTIVGELGFYTGQVRSATVTAEQVTVVHRLTAAALAGFEQEQPELAAAFHRLMTRTIAERLVDTNQALQAALA